MRQLPGRWKAVMSLFSFTRPHGWLMALWCFVWELIDRQTHARTHWLLMFRLCMCTCAYEMKHELSESTDLRQGGIHESDDFQNSAQTFLSKDTSVIKFSQRFDQFFSRDISQIVENALSCNVEKSFRKFLESGPDAKYDVLTFTICHCPSVCLSSVTIVHCTLLRRLKLSTIFLRHLARRPSADIQVKFYGDRPRGSRI